MIDSGVGEPSDGLRREETAGRFEEASGEVAVVSCSVVIRACNEEEHIGRLLTGVLQQSVGDVEVILVDSGSEDATVSIASRFPVRVLSIRPDEFSFGRSLNIGCEAAQGEILVFASAHVYPLYTNWLAKLTGPFSEPGVGVTYGRQVGDETTRFSEKRLFEQWFPGRSHRAQGHPFCNNANAAIRRELWERYRFNESLTGLEDIDMAKRLSANGYTISYVAEAVVAHIHNESGRRILSRYRREAMALREIFPDQMFSALDFIRLFVANSVSDLRYAFAEGMLPKVAREVLMFRFLQFFGTYLGHRQPKPLSESLRKRFYYPASQLRGAAVEEGVTGKPVDYTARVKRSK